jgi:hypothetical protein
LSNKLKWSIRSHTEITDDGRAVLWVTSQMRNRTNWVFQVES